MNDNKPWYEKVNIWIGITAGICAILTFIITLCTMTDDTTEEAINIIEDDLNIQDSVQVIGDDNITITGNVSGDININTNSAPETNMSSESSTTENETTNQFNFGQAIQHIYSNEESIQKEIINNEENKPINSSIYPGVSYWYISDKVRLIVVTNGFRDNECSRTYYFDKDGKLSVALMKDNIGEHRLYFYNDILIRYIDEHGQNHDINQDLNNYECKWTELSLNESYEIFNGVKKTSEEDFLVTATYDMNVPQTSINGVNVLVEAETSFPADRVTISGISGNNKFEPKDMHGGLYKWQFVANFYIKGTYTITVTAYISDGESVSDEFTYIY
ncbi:MAG: hypothetical protein HDR00_11090 [Lachnospiraceae bacterium]|nr:hypothetical protein [Lachnospiraceae bacterium]